LPKIAPIATQLGNATHKPALGRGRKFRQKRHIL
jgi:hypothetical protein